MDTLLQIVFWFWFSVFGVGFVDMAMQLQNQTIKAYKKGPIKAAVFTRKMTGDPKQ